MCSRTAVNVVGKYGAYALIVLLCAAISGCATEAYYLDSQSAGYNQQVWNCVCEGCGRVFTISSSQYDSGAPVSCCYCGVAQDPRLARNRGKYAEQQQQTYNNQQAAAYALQSYTAINQQAAANRQQIIQNFQNNVGHCLPTQSSTTNVTAQTIGNTTYYNGGVSGTAQKIGNTTYYNLKDNK